MTATSSTKSRAWLFCLIILAAVSFAYAPKGAHASNVQFVGGVTYTYLGNTAVLTANKVENFDPLGSGISGTLHLELWAFPTPYTGSFSLGYKLAQYSLGQLLAGYYFPNINSGAVLFIPPANGTWYFTMVLTEYTAGPLDGGYTPRDYVNFPTPQTFGPPPPPPGQLQMPAPVTFPTQQVGTQSAPIALTVKNIGGSAVTISSVTNSDLTEFPGTTTCLASIPAGSSCQVTVSFHPTTAGAHNATITITSTGVGSPQSFTVSGTGLAAPPPGQLQMPAPVTFPTQQVGTQSAPIVVMVTNIGGSSVTVSNVTNSDLTEFPGTTSCFTTLPAGGNCQITVSFLPTTAGAHNATITITSTGVGSPQSFTVSGTGMAAPQPGQLQMPSPVTFPNQQVGTQSAPITVTVTNIGGSPVTISSVNGTDLSEFPGTTSCLTTIPAGGNCQITVSFLPTAVGVRTETVTVTSTGVGSPQSFIVSGTGSTAATSSNYEGLWWASPPGSESGWGINLAHQGDTIFASWFTYDAAGKGLWLVMTALKTGANTYAGALYTTTGPAFNAVPFNPAQVVATQVGTGTLTFTDANTGSFSYTVNGISQAKAITRQVFGTLPTCSAANGSLAAATNYQDLWWAAPAGSESGWGINFTHQGDTIFATWFTYDVDHSPMWLVVTAPKTAPGVYSGTLYRTTGPAFSAAPFNPANVMATAMGTATFTFSDGNNATFSYTVNGVSQAKPITREVFQNPGTVCQ
jgi:hypothetical protein